MLEDEIAPEQFMLSVTGSYGSVRNTLVHVLGAEGARVISICSFSVGETGA